MNDDLVVKMDVILGHIEIRDMPPIFDANGMTFRSRHLWFDGNGKCTRNEVFLGARMVWD